MKISRDILKGLLDELAQWMEFEDCEPVEWVVCGGVALTLQGLLSRTTRDVDVLGNWDAQGMKIAFVDQFPDDIKACIRKVTGNHPELDGLDEEWVNLGASQLTKFGLPSGFEGRLTPVRFRERLTLQLLSRNDLLALKLYAAADELGHRQDVHQQDLMGLNPTFDELDKAVDWIRTLPDFEEMRLKLKEAVGRLGHEDLAYYI